MTFLDWTIVLVFFSLITFGAYLTQRYMKSVADFLSAGRSAGRYLVSLSGGIASLGAITVIGQFEMNFAAGFTMQWWNFTYHFFLVLMALSGWVIYRFRETRALTLAQFFEIRYSRKFRIFSGIVAFVAGIINFGIFPAVGARFFLYFCGFPETYMLFGLEISTFATLMIFLLGASLYFVLSGGQITVLITDFVQGLFVSIVFIVISIYFFNMFTFDQMVTALQTAPEGASLINPYDTSRAEEFNFWYFAISILGLWYGPLTWQGTQGINSSAKDAHEAKMGQVLSYWRLLPQIIFLVMIPVCAYVVLNHADFASIASNVDGVLAGLASGTERSQLTVPLVLTELLPIGLKGCFAAVMLAAFISTHDTYLHSWASIFVQDVVMPIRNRPIEPEKHIQIIRYTIVAIAIFIFIFSLVYPQNSYILFFFAITGSIFISGAGATIVFGLYWKGGTTAGAWSAMISGASVSVLGLVLNQIYDDFPIHEVYFGALAMLAACLAYIVASKLTEKTPFNLDKMLHRGEYAIKEEHNIVHEEVATGWKVFGIGKEFTSRDKIIYIGSYIWITMWLLIFISGTVMHFTDGIANSEWVEFWFFFMVMHIVFSIMVIIWFGIGGFKDIMDTLKRLANLERDESDDGSVRK